MLKQHLCKFLFITSLLFFSSLNSVQAEECISNNSSVLVINGKTGKILFADQSDAIIYPASLTKLMTLYLTFEALKHKKLKMNQKLLISSRAQETSEINTILTLNLKAGDKISVSKAVRGLIVKSFNGLSVALAEAVAGDEWQFARNMNVKARELGMKFSNFRNSSGFDNVGQYSTNEDLIKLVLALKKDFPEYEHLFAIKIFNYNGKRYKTHNDILLKYTGATGMKTGFTNMAGFNLIASATKDDQHIISSITGCESSEKRYELTKELLDNAFRGIE